jgi:hypothetical protein
VRVPCLALLPCLPNPGSWIVWPGMASCARALAAVVVPAVVWQSGSCLPYLAGWVPLTCIPWSRWCGNTVKISSSRHLTRDRDCHTLGGVGRERATGTSRTGRGQDNPEPGSAAAAQQPPKDPPGPGQPPELLTGTCATCTFTALVPAGNKHLDNSTQRASRHLGQGSSGHDRTSAMNLGGL